MEGQGQRDRYGNPARQPSQTYPQGFGDVGGQGFQATYGQGRTQTQMSGSAPNYGTGQSGTARPGSSSYAYGQSMTQFPSVSNSQLQYGGDFSTDATRQSYQQMIGYYPQAQTGYDQLSYQRAQQSQIPSQPFPEYYPETSYSAVPQTPSHLVSYSQTAYTNRAGRSSIPSPYTPMSTGYQPYDQGQMHPPSVPPQHHHSLQQAESARPNDGYREYLRKLRETFEHIQSGRLAEGGQTLLGASESLLGRVEELGLTRDNEHAYDQRLKMWKDFNICWLSFMQKLKETLQATVTSGQQLASAQNIVALPVLERMAERLIDWADKVERWGLVDYEMGVWEEEILEVAGDCRSLFESHPDLFVIPVSQQRPP